MKLTTAVLKYLAELEGRPTTPDDIAEALGLPRKRAHNVYNALADLVDRGKVIWVGDEVMLLSRKRETTIGKLIVKEEGYGFLVPDGPRDDSAEDFYVPRDAMGMARHGDKVSAEVRRFQGGRAEAYIEKVLERSQRALLGLYVGGGGGGYVVPDQLPGVRRVVIVGGQTLGAKDNQKVEFEIPDNQPLQETMRGKVLAVLGYPGELAAERATLLRMYGFPLQFPKEVVEAAEAMSAEPDEKRDKNREDLTHLVCCTIDPADAKDFDDAVTLEPTDEGWLGAVHIADVSSYVTPDSEIDKSAIVRATSVYLPQGAAPMLPEHLTGDICSLRPNERRRALSVVFRMTPDGEIIDRKVVRSWIKSRKRFDYEEVQAMLDEYDRKRGKPDRWIPRIKAGVSTPWEARVAGLRWFSRKLRSERLEMGGIEFVSSEVRIELDANGKPIAVKPRAVIESYQVIEEWMLLANRTVTELFHSTMKHKVPFVYRIHEKPDDAKLEEFIVLGEDLGYAWTGGHPTNSKDYQRYIHSLRDKPEARVLMDLAIRAMMRAKYTTSNEGHFGLGFDDYTHFTSPIRRYPDIMVHRLLGDYLVDKKRKKLDDEYAGRLEAMCEVCSEREQGATEAEREGVKWKQVEYLQNFVGEILDAIVVAVKPRGIFIELTETLAQTFMPADRLYDGYLVYDPRRHELRSRNQVHTIRLGDKVKVRIAKVELRRHRFEAYLDDGSKPVAKVAPREGSTLERKFDEGESRRQYELRLKKEKYDKQKMMQFARKQSKRKP